MHIEESDVVIYEVDLWKFVKEIEDNFQKTQKPIVKIQNEWRKKMIEIAFAITYCKWWIAKFWNEQKSVWLKNNSIYFM